MIYLYAIAAKYDESVKPPLGVEGEEVYQLKCSSFYPVISFIMEGKNQISLSKESVYKHENVIECYMEQMPLLPVRFNTLFKNKDELVSVLERYSLEIETNLLKVTDCIEMGVKALVKEESLKKQKNNGNLKFDKGISKAKKYILDKFQEHKESFYLQEEYKAVGKQIFNLLEKYAKQGKAFPLTANSLLILNSAFLVQNNSLETFKEQFQKIKGKHNDLAFLLSGPWPPYSFIDFSIERKDEAKACQ